MTDIKSIRKAVEALSPAELAEFRQWFAEFNATGHAPTKTLPYDVADQLRTPEEIAAYPDAWLQEAPGDAAGIARALSDLARAKPHLDDD